MGAKVPAPAGVVSERPPGSAGRGVCLGVGSKEPREEALQGEEAGPVVTGAGVSSSAGPASPALGSIGGSNVFHELDAA